MNRDPCTNDNCRNTTPSNVEQGSVRGTVAVGTRGAFARDFKDGSSSWQDGGFEEEQENKTLRLHGCRDQRVEC